MKLQKIEVKADSPYDLFLGASLEGLGEYLCTQYNDLEHIMIISNHEVAALYEERLKSGLTDFRVDSMYIPAGEKEKTLERLSQLTSVALRFGSDRQSLVVALGGGVIGDLAGFFASVFMRGIRFLQVPTTLLAQVDSSIGGKVAVNHPAGKNILGAFYPPLAVWSDFSILESLPWEEVHNGLAESIKHAMIADPVFFAFLEDQVEALKEEKRSLSLWREVVISSAMVKVRIVSLDEREQGERALLNLGHSFGHALETEMNYTGVTHGQAVSVGLAAAAYLSKTRRLVTDAEYERIKALLQAFDLPVKISDLTSQDLDPMDLLQRMQADKKNQGGRKILILPQGIGRATVVGDCTDKEILEAWNSVGDEA